MIATAMIEQDVLDVLASAHIDESMSCGPVVRLTGHLERKLYERTNKALEALGGKWNRHRAGHVFALGTDVAALIADAIDSQSYVDPRLNGYFPTPPDLARKLVDWADIRPGMTVLEPSAGRGALADVAAEIVGRENVHVCELLYDNAEVLRAKGYWVTYGDFLEAPYSRVFDRVILNPPFAKKADILHVQHALTLLRPGGVLVAIMSAGVKSNTDRLSVWFRDELAHRNGEMIDNPPDSFAGVGTRVATVMVRILA